MIHRLSDHAFEEGTYIVTIDFVDEAGDPQVPNAGLNWTLVDDAGNVINSRTGVSISPASSVAVVLSGDDLALAGSEAEERHLVVQGTYNSATYGSDLPLKVEVIFWVVEVATV